jgi:rhodanese-related sulfurtransferase
MFLTSLKEKGAAFARLAELYFSPINAQSGEKFQAAIRSRFPHVRQISTKDLARWLAAPSPPAPLALIDARNPAEFAVSHLCGAQNCRTTAAVATLVPDKTRRLVVYCSVGYRSCALADKLQRAGYTNVFNLEGSIFAWANEGRPVFQGKAELRPARIHPYNRKWGQLLNESLRAVH